MVIDTDDFRNYKFVVSDDKIEIEGPFVGIGSDRCLVCYKHAPIVYLTTGNVSENILRKHLHRLHGARMVRSENVLVYDEDPSGRRVPRWTVNRQVWDLSECFNYKQ